MDEQLLSDKDSSRSVLRVGDTVRRPVEFWQPAVVDLLKYLESVGFGYSPRHLGFDDKGREVLTYIDGESGKAGWFNIISEDGLKKYAKLLRSYHEAIEGYKPPANLEWSTGGKSLGKGDIVCHGDFGPWNIVWRQGEPIGILDWDLAHPNTFEHDVLYALEYAAPFRDDEIAKTWHHFERAPDRKRRIDMFLESYGIGHIDNLAQKVARMQREVGGHEKYLAERGIHPQVDWVLDGDLIAVEKRAEWTEANISLFS